MCSAYIALEALHLRNGQGKAGDNYRREKMILLDDDLRFGFGLFSENDAIRAYFKGIYYRAVPATVFDKTNGQNTVGVIYVCAQNVLLLLQTHSTHGQLYQLEIKDTFRTLDQDNELLKKAANDQSAMRRFINVKTSHPVTFVELNSRYIFIIDFIQPMNSNFGAITIASETWLVGKNYIEKNANLLRAINAVLHGQPFDFTIDLPGDNKQQNVFARYWILIVILLSIIAVIGVLVYMNSRPGPGY